jgi:hypothetical protein
MVWTYKTNRGKNHLKFNGDTHNPYDGAEEFEFEFDFGVNNNPLIFIVTALLTKHNNLLCEILSLGLSRTLSDF